MGLTIPRVRLKHKTQNTHQRQPPPPHPRTPAHAIHQVRSRAQRRIRRLRVRRAARVERVACRVSGREVVAGARNVKQTRQRHTFFNRITGPLVHYPQHCCKPAPHLTSLAAAAPQPLRAHCSAASFALHTTAPHPTATSGRRRLGWACWSQHAFPCAPHRRLRQGCSVDVIRKCLNSRWQ